MARWITYPTSDDDSNENDEEKKPDHSKDNQLLQRQQQQLASGSKIVDTIASSTTGTVGGGDVKGTAVQTSAVMVSSGKNNGSCSSGMMIMSGAPAAQGIGDSGATRLPFQGRSLMSAEWLSQRAPNEGVSSGIVRNWMKPMTAGSWTPTKHTEALAYTGGRGEGGNVKQSRDSSEPGEGGGSRRSDRGRRGLGKTWDGLYQIRPFDHETPP